MKRVYLGEVLKQLGEELFESAYTKNHPYEYAVTEWNSQGVGVDQALVPIPPDDRRDWLLISVNILNTVFVYHWKRLK